jgi:hypothetical protein
MSVSKATASPRRLKLRESCLPPSRLGDRAEASANRIHGRYVDFARGGERDQAIGLGHMVEGPGTPTAVTPPPSVGGGLIPSGASTSTTTPRRS